jgi:hypothetical protein
MNHIDDKEAIERLRKAGWTASEIERLRRLRRDYVEKEGGQAPATIVAPGLSVGWWRFCKKDTGPLLPGGGDCGNHASLLAS